MEEEQEFKRKYPQLSKLFDDLKNNAQYYDIYGMRVKCCSIWEYDAIKREIDNRTPEMFYRILPGRDQTGRPYGIYFNYN